MLSTVRSLLFTDSTGLDGGITVPISQVLCSQKCVMFRMDQLTFHRSLFLCKIWHDTLMIADVPYVMCMYEIVSGRFNI